jgi:glycosyltransferase involved in cell wall biosynthesis
MKALVLPQQMADGRFTSGSSLRLLHPLEHLAKKDANFSFRTAKTLEQADCDVVILERYIREDIDFQALREYVAAMKAKGVRVIHELDDNLYEHFLETKDAEKRRLLPVVAYLSRESDAVICSTQALAEVARRFNDRVYVYENHLPKALVRKAVAPENKKHEGIRIGYFGTFTHVKDFLLVVPALKEVLKRHPEASFHIVGVAEQQELKELMGPYPFHILRAPDVAYDAFFSWLLENHHWDIALAPLVDTPLNRCKSDLKLLDYSLIGAVGVYSKLTPYLDIGAQGAGIVVENSTEEWLDALLLLTQDGGMRKELHSRALGVLGKRTMEDRADELLDIIKDVAQK